MKTLGILSFTQNGRELEKKIMANMPQVQWIKKEESESGKEFVQSRFNDCEGWIFIGACGIFVRFIAPLIKSKDVDPAVVVLDEKGENVISLLSGHLGGGNELTCEISRLVGGRAVITTATDINHKFAVDNWAKSMNLRIKDISIIKEISSRILKNEKIGLYSDFKIKGEIPDFIVDCSEMDASEIKDKIQREHVEAGIIISFDGDKKVFPVDFNVMPETVTLGLGCRRGIPSDKLEDFVLRVLRENGIHILCVRNMASIDLKKDETCMLDFARKYKREFLTFSSKELNDAKGEFTKSDFVSSITGVDNVCERSAFLGSNEGKIIVRKTKFEGMTMAVAVKEQAIEF